MKKLIKNFVLFCGIYAIAQGSHCTIALAANNMDKSSDVSTVTASTSLDTNKDISNSKAIDGNTNRSYDKSTSENNTPEKANSNVGQSTNYDTIVKVSIPVSKKWKISFNQPVDVNSLNGKIRLVDNNNTEVPLTLSSPDYGMSVIVSPTNVCNPDTDYTLTISGNIVSRYNRKLKNPTVVEFKTAPVISSIDNISVTINQEDDYTLPTQVTAKMSNDTTTSVNVSWNKSVDMTSIPGVYAYTGTVDGYSKPVTLNLTIKAFEPVPSVMNDYRIQSQIGTNLYNYLMNYDNRQSVLDRAVELHGGDTSNNCVFYASEALRRAGMTDLPESVANTNQLTSQLQSRGWQTSTDLSKLLPGDICFTTSYGSGPTHTYTFMKWVDPKSFDYAYICDNQGYDYNGDAYHKRNIDFETPTKDCLSYFMYLA